MAVEFYDLNDKNLQRCIFQLNESDFEKLQNVLAEYKKLTGLIIDQYGNTRIHEDHVKLIVKLIDKSLVNNYHPDLQLLQIKENFNSNIKNLIAVGD
jgi:hypothetical protein